MSVSLKSNFFKNARGITLTDGGGAAWSFNSSTNAIGICGRRCRYRHGNIRRARQHRFHSERLAGDHGRHHHGELGSASRCSRRLVYLCQPDGEQQGVITAVSNGVQPVTSVTSTADTTATSNALTADAQLTLTFNETGKYAIEIFLPFYEAAVGTGGFQFDLNSGSATVGGIVFGVDGFVTGAVANAAITSVSTATTAATIATSASAPRGS